MARVLLIDDDDVLRGALLAVLADAGYEVADAPDGSAGLRLYRERGADLVIVDIFMPEVDGLEVIRALRVDASRPRIIAMSGGGRAENLDTLTVAASLGAARTLRKPFTPRDLLDAVRDVLGQPLL